MKRLQIRPNVLSAFIVVDLGQTRLMVFTIYSQTH